MFIQDNSEINLGYLTAGLRGEYFNLKERKCQKSEEEWADRDDIIYIPHEIKLEETNQKRLFGGGGGLDGACNTMEVVINSGVYRVLIG